MWLTEGREINLSVIIGEVGGSFRGWRLDGADFNRFGKQSDNQNWKGCLMKWRAHGLGAGGGGTRAACRCVLCGWCRPNVLESGNFPSTLEKQNVWKHSSHLLCRLPAAEDGQGLPFQMRLEHSNSLSPLLITEVE